MFSKNTRRLRSGKKKRQIPTRIKQRTTDEVPMSVSSSDAERKWNRTAVNEAKPGSGQATHENTTRSQNTRRHNHYHNIITQLHIE